VSLSGEVTTVNARQKAAGMYVKACSKIASAKLRIGGQLTLQMQLLDGIHFLSRGTDRLSTK
jgi:hypothetical protein